MEKKLRMEKAHIKEAEETEKRERKMRKNINDREGKEDIKGDRQTNI